VRFLFVLALAVAGCGDGSGGGGLDASAAVDSARDDAVPFDAGPRDATRADVVRPDADDDAAFDAPEPTLGPPYPIVLAHGFFGFEDFAGISFVQYFFGVRAALEADGETMVFTPAVDPFNDSTVRGHMLLEEIDRIRHETGHARVNLIAHSQGGLDARVVAHERPDMLASVVTISTPHAGTELADVVLGLVSDPRQRDLADALARAIAAPLYEADGSETSVFAALRQLSTEGAREFDRVYWDDRSVPFYSIAGRSDWHPGGRDCLVPDAPPFVARWIGEVDPVDSLLSIPESLLDGGFGESFPNDGLVRVADARRGRFLGCIPADHLDEMGHLLGDSPGLGNSFDHREFYVELVRWLREQGH
jgi:triacylglycerol lipase